MSLKKKKPTPDKGKRQTSSPPQSVTCMHCRYERPVEGKQCPTCGYPWPWLKES